MAAWRLPALVVCALAAGCAHEAAHGRAWVHDVHFVGLGNVDSDALAARLAVEETGWAPWAAKKWLDEFALAGDRERIEAWLRARGYWDARVVEARARPYKRGGVDVEITVDQGDVTRIASVSVSGVDPARFELHAGDAFDHDRYVAAKEALADALRRQGYAWPRVDGAVSVDPERHEAAVRITVVPGVKPTLGSLDVVGTSRVDPKLVARHAGLRAGEPYRPERLEEMRGRIYELGLFSSVSVDLEERGGGVAHVRVTVRDAPATELRVGFGLGVEDQRQDVHGRVAWMRHGIGHRLRRLRLSLEPAYVVTPAVWDVRTQGPATTADLELRQLDLPWRYSTISWTLGYDLGIDYAYQFHGPRTQLAFSQALWHDRIHLGVGYNFQFLDFFNTNEVVLKDPSQGGAAVLGYTDPYRLGWFNQEVALDLRDHPLDAHRGFYTSVGVEEGGVYAGGAFTYEKVSTQARAYLPLGEEVTLAGALQFGQMVSQGDSPITRRFYLGGPTSHRGFSYNRLAPYAGDASTGRVPIGGEQMLLIQAELRIQLVQVYGQWVGLVVFGDGGDVVRSGSVDVGNLHWAAGGGVRLKTSIGSFRVDVAGRINRVGEVESDGRLNPDPGQRVAYHFSFGEAF